MIGAAHERTRTVPMLKEYVQYELTDWVGARLHTGGRRSSVDERYRYHRNAALYESAQTLKSRQTEA